MGLKGFGIPFVFMCILKSCFDLAFTADGHPQQKQQVSWWAPSWIPTLAQMLLCSGAVWIVETVPAKVAVHCWHRRQWKTSKNNNLNFFKNRHKNEQAFWDELRTLWASKLIVQDPNGLTIKEGINHKKEFETFSFQCAHFHLVMCLLWILLLWNRKWRIFFIDSACCSIKLFQWAYSY